MSSRTEGQVLLGRRAAHPRQQRGDDRDGDDRLRQAPDHEGAVVGGQAPALEVVADRGRVAHDHEQADLVDQDERHGPLGQRERLAQARAAPVEARLEPQARGPDVGDHGHRLDGDAQRRTHADQAQDRLPGADRGRAQRVLDDPPVAAEHRDGDDVGQDRRPHHRPEAALGVEDLAEDDEHAVEEDLRQAQLGEDDRDRPVLRLREAGEQVDQLRRGEHGDDREHQERDHGQGDQAAGERRAAVPVPVHGAHQLRHEDRVQRAAQDQDVDDVRQVVAGVVGVAQGAGGQRGDDHELPDQAGGPGGHRAQGHQPRGAADVGLGLRLGLRRRGLGRGPVPTARTPAPASRSPVPCPLGRRGAGWPAPGPGRGGAV